LLGSAWLIITVVLVIAAAITRQSLLLVVAVIFFLSSGIARLWSRYALQRLEYKRHLSSNQVFFGESITLDLSISNLKFLPLPWLRIEEEIPEDLTLLKGKTQASYKPGRVVISNFISLSWYHRLTRRFPVQCLKRGIYEFGPTAIHSGDPFGFFHTETTVEQTDQLLVYPRILPLEELGIPSRHPFGDLRVRRHLFEDPILVMTTRDYAAGDPLKHIHWKASARSQTMQSRVFEHTTSVDLAVFLDTRTVSDTIYWSLISPDFLETAVLTATSISADAIKKDFGVGFYSNEYYWYSDRLMKLPPSNHPDQLKNILRALAQVRGLPAMPAEQMLNREMRNLAWETTVLVITAVPTEGLLAVLKRFQQAGRKVALVQIGGGSSSIKSGGLLTYHVSEDLYRKKLESLSLRQDSL
jgi:uncharacterized protein (DUF58 family)